LIEVHLTGQLSDFTRGIREVELDRTDDVQAMVRGLDARFPGIGQRILDDQDRIRMYVNIFVNSENSRELEKEKTKLKDGDIVHILPSVAGG
jgi:molybdopterin converting factor small subunit